MRPLADWDLEILEILWDKSDAAGHDDARHYINMELCRRNGSFVTMALPYAISRNDIVAHLAQLELSDER